MQNIQTKLAVSALGVTSVFVSFVIPQVLPQTSVQNATQPATLIAVGMPESYAADTAQPLVTDPVPVVEPIVEPVAAEPAPAPAPAPAPKPKTVSCDKSLVNSLQAQIDQALWERDDHVRRGKDVCVYSYGVGWTLTELCFRKWDKIQTSPTNQWNIQIANLTPQLEAAQANYDSCMAGN